MDQYAVIGVFTSLGLLFVGGALVASKLLAYTSADTGKKHEPYECSEDTFGGARLQFKVGYYLFALVFLIFDVEALFLFPCAKIFKQVLADPTLGISTGVILAELLIFIAILSFGLVFAWKKRVLEWE